MVYLSPKDYAGIFRDVNLRMSFRYSNLYSFDFWMENI